MTHLGFVAASYAFGLTVPVGFAISSARRLSTARRKLAAIDPRSARPGNKPGNRPGTPSRGPRDDA